MATRTLIFRILGAALVAILPLASIAADQPSSAAQVEMLRKNLGARKSAIVLETLELNDADAGIFRKIYSAHEVNLAKLNDERVAIMVEFVANLIDMTDEKARELIARSINYQKSRLALIEDTTNKVADALSPVVAGRFYQIETQLIGIVDTQLSQDLPLLPKSVQQDLIQ